MIRPTFAVRRRLALAERGLTNETVAALRPMLNPVLIPMAEALPGGLRAALTNQPKSAMGSPAMPARIRPSSLVAVSAPVVASGTA